MRKHMALVAPSDHQAWQVRGRSVQQPAGVQNADSALRQGSCRGNLRAGRGFCLNDSWASCHRVKQRQEQRENYRLRQTAWHVYVGKAIERMN